MLGEGKESRSGMCRVRLCSALQVALKVQIETRQPAQYTARRAIPYRRTWLYFPAATRHGIRPVTSMPSFVSTLILRGLLVCSQAGRRTRRQATRRKAAFLHT